MPTEEPATTLLLMLRLRSSAGTDELASELRSSGAVLRRALTRLCEAGLVRRWAEGSVDGWSLTTEGRREAEAVVRDELCEAGADQLVAETYSAFLPLDRELLRICTDWQTVRVGDRVVPNDHSDPVRDEALLGRFDALHLRAGELLAPLVAVSARFERYPVRLGHAHRQVRAGRTEWLVLPTLPSYHTTWHELHEHLLVALGRDRTDRDRTSCERTDEVGAAGPPSLPSLASHAHGDTP